MKFSIIVPVYNEEQSLKILTEKLASVFKKDWRETELIFVNDGSTDGSLEALVRLARKYQNLKIINFRVNQGKSDALNAGFKKAEGEIVVTLDADLQDEPTEIPKLIRKLASGYDMVSSWKKQRQDPKEKKFLSQIFNRVVGALTKIDIHDFNSGLKAYRKQVVKEINVYGELHRFIPILAAQKGFSLAEVSVVHNERLYGASKYGLSRVPQGFFDLFTVLFLNKFKRSPMYFFGGVGVALLVVGGLILSYLSILRLEGETIGTRPLLTFGILFVISGLQFVFTGFLAELMVHYMSGKNSHG